MYFLLHPIACVNLLVAKVVTDRLTFLFCVFFFVYLALNYKNPFWQRLDKNVAEWVKTSKDSIFKSRAEDISIFGNAIFHILFCVILSLVFLIFKHQWKTALAVIFTLVFSWIFNRLLKIVFKRERPRKVASNIRRRLSYCFPSGHVMASIGIYFFSAVLLQALIPFIPWYLVAFFVSFLVVITRIYLNHHFFTDVLTGVLLGVFCLDVSIWFYFYITVL